MLKTLMSIPAPKTRILLVGIGFLNIPNKIIAPNTEILEITAIGKTLNLKTKANVPMQPNFGSQFPISKVLTPIKNVTGRTAPIKKMAIFLKKETTLPPNITLTISGSWALFPDIRLHRFVSYHLLISSLQTL